MHRDRRNHRDRSKALAAGCAAAVLLAVAFGWAVARACSTPVYRYAMYNWASAPYQVFYFHDGQPADEEQPADEDEAVNKTLAGLYDAEPASANVLLHVVDTSQDGQIELLPKVVVEARQAGADGSPHPYIVFSPWGAKLYAGRMDPQQVQAMVDSPARQRLGELLDEGSAAVLLILTGPDENANQRAEKAAADVVAKAAAGEIPIAAAPDDFTMPGDLLPEPAGDTPTDDPGKDAGNNADDDAPEVLKLAVLKVARDDPAETWLVRMLLLVEPDLHEYPTDPMVFAVYGRGRAMPPYVGKGITVENLSECVIFLVGACSCMVKDQNPGMDLLMRWDWQSTANKMAAEDEGISNGPLGYQEFTAADSGDQAERAEPATAAETNNAAETAAADGKPEASVAGSGSGPSDERRTGGPTPEPSSGPDGTEDASQSFAARQAWKLGVGLGVGAICVLAAGLLVVRRRRTV